MALSIASIGKFMIKILSIAVGVDSVKRGQIETHDALNKVLGTLAEMQIRDRERELADRRDREARQESLDKRLDKMEINTAETASKVWTADEDYREIRAELGQVKMDIAVIKEKTKNL